MACAGPANSSFHRTDVPHSSFVRRYVRHVRAAHPALAGYLDRATVKDPTFPVDRLGNYVLGATGRDAQELTVQDGFLLLDDDDGLCWMATDMVEPFLDVHWSEIADAFEVAARNSTIAQGHLLFVVRRCSSGRSTTTPPRSVL